MSSVLPHLKAHTRPVAHPDAIIRPNEQVRFTILTPRLIRMEYAPDGRFEDRASQTFWFREQPVPPLETNRKANELIAETAGLAEGGGGAEAGFLPTWREV